MNESALKSAALQIMRERLRGFVPLRHEDVRTSGIPDLSVTGYGKTSWWEFKHANPDFKTTGIQELTMLRLAGAGYARYVVWEERNGIKRTLIVHPKYVKDASTMAEIWLPGFDMAKLCDCIKAVHGGMLR